MGFGRFLGSLVWTMQDDLSGIELDAEEREITIAKVNTDVNPVTPGKYGVRGIPYLVLFHNGEPVDQHTGAAPKPFFDNWLNRHME